MTSLAGIKVLRGHWPCRHVCLHRVTVTSLPAAKGGGLLLLRSVSAVVTQQKTTRNLQIGRLSSYCCTVWSPAACDPIGNWRRKCHYHATSW